jgi:uncharacterized protein YegP (UPF0339 family)
MEVEFYQDTADEWRWRAIADNNDIIATSSEGYNKLADCEHGLIVLALELRKAAKVVELGKDGGKSVGNLQALMDKHNELAGVPLGFGASRR